MKLQRIFFALSIMFILALLFAIGCAGGPEKGQVTIKPEPEKQTITSVTEKPAELVLKFTQGDSATYRVIMEKDKSLEFSGELSRDRNFKGGHTGSKAEITFDRQIQSIDDEGNAVARITIKDLKYLMKVRNQVVVDFDSSRQEDRRNILNKLIGKSYEITITPKGEVVEVSGTVQIEASVRGNAPSERAAAQLVSQEIIEKCHQVPALIYAGAKKYNPGDKWKGQKTFSFDFMGSDSYEKIYTLKEIRVENGRKVAFVDMIAVPGPKEGQTGVGLSRMFDQTSGYNGKMKFDLTNGQIAEYFEQMQSEWTVVDPESAQRTDQSLSTIKMGTTELYSIEKID